MVRFPRFLSPGDRVALVAPSSPFEAAEFLAARERLAREFEVVVGSDVASRDDYLAGSDTRRLVELQEALDDERVAAVIAVRGGYGAGRIAGHLDPTRFRVSPKWIAGFSDITVLHAWAQRQGIASLHAPNAGGAGRLEEDAQSLVDALCGRRTSSQWEVHSFRAFDAVEGLAAGGNLTVLAYEAVAGRLPSMHGRVLFLEDVGERVYRIDRMLAALADGGFFAGVRAIVFGHFTRCEGAPNGRTLARLARELEERLGIPVVHGAPFGHEAPNEPFAQGALVRVEPEAVTFSKE
jgi:muramoyltetrapeptide carboxypeptidase